MNFKKDKTPMHLTAFIICFTLLIIYLETSEKRMKATINVNKSVARASAVVVEGPFRGGYRIEFMFVYKSRLIKNNQSISASDYNNYKIFIRDSALVVFDSSNTNSSDFIYKPSHFKQYGLDTGDLFYKGLYWDKDE